MLSDKIQLLRSWEASNNWATTFDPDFDDLSIMKTTTTIPLERDDRLKILACKTHSSTRADISTQIHSQHTCDLIWERSSFSRLALAKMAMRGSRSIELLGEMARAMTSSEMTSTAQSGFCSHSKPASLVATSDLPEHGYPQKRIRGITNLSVQLRS